MIIYLLEKKYNNILYICLQYKVLHFKIWTIKNKSISQVVNVGQIICGLIAVDPITAQDAIKLIHVQYEELKPIITIEVCTIVNPYF